MLFLWLTLALGQDEPEKWKDREIVPKGLTDGTAFTIDKKEWRVGLVSLEYGLLENLTVGINPPLFLLTVVNAHGKVTAVQTPKLDVALEGGIYALNLKPLSIDGNVRLTPVSATATWTPHRKVGISAGPKWNLATVQGRLSPEQMATAIAGVSGADISEDLTEVLGNGGAYAGANFTLYQVHAQAEYRLNRRDSIVFQSNTFLALTGLVAAGAELDAGNDTEVQAGASARLSMPLRNSLPSLNTLSWQFSWRKAHLRVGVPLPLGNSFAWLQAVDVYWVLGPNRVSPKRAEKRANR